MNEITIKQLEKCRLCYNNKLIEIPSLGDQMVINFSELREERQLFAPLDLVVCENCGLLQLKYTVSRDAMYKKYWYMSGISTLMISYLNDIVNSAQRFIKLNKGDIVIDIGANDGTLLWQ